MMLLRQHHVWLHTSVLILILNIVFAILLLFSILVPPGVISNRIQHAFESGELTESDYLKYDIHRGFHQYNDCNILQMMTNKDSSPVEDALGPWFYMPDDSATEACRTLRELVVDGKSPETLVSSRYTRYWHGYIPILSALLVFLEISTVRMMLRVAVYAAVLFLLMSSFREKCFLLLTAPVFIAGVFFWGLPYFGQGMSHAFGDSVVMLGLAGLIFWHRKLGDTGRLIPYCALFGAVVVYFEMLTGPLPVAAGLLFPAVYLLSRLTDPSDTKINQHLRLAALALIAFAVGAILTVGARLLVAATLLQPNGLDLFVGNLSLYSQPLDSTPYVPGFLRPLGRLFRRGAVLTYGSSWGLGALYTSVILSWLVSGWLAFKRATYLSRVDLLAFVIGAASIPVWTTILQSHTFMHADFMVRILIVPISLGWASMLWQLWSRHREQLKLIDVSHSSMPKLDHSIVSK